MTIMLLLVHSCILSFAYLSENDRSDYAIRNPINLDSQKADTVSVPFLVRAPGQGYRWIREKVHVYPSNINERDIEALPELMNEGRFNRNGLKQRSDFMHVLADEGQVDEKARIAMLRDAGVSEWDDARPRPFDFGVSILPPLWYLEKSALALDKRLGGMQQDTDESMAIKKDYLRNEAHRQEEQSLLYDSERETDMSEFDDEVEEALGSYQIYAKDAMAWHDRLMNRDRPMMSAVLASSSAAMAKEVDAKLNESYQLNQTLIGEVDGKLKQATIQGQQKDKDSVGLLSTGVLLSGYNSARYDGDNEVQRRKKDRIESYAIHENGLTDQWAAAHNQKLHRLASAVDQALSLSNKQRMSKLATKELEALQKVLPVALAEGSDGPEMVSSFGHDHGLNVALRNRRQDRQIEQFNDALDSTLHNDLHSWHQRHTTNNKIEVQGHLRKALLRR